MFRTLLFAICFFGSSISYTQDIALIDSLEQALSAQADDDTLRILTLINLWRATSQNDVNRAKIYAERMITDSRQMGYPKGEATGYQRLGIVQDYLGLGDSALVNYRRALRIYEAKGWDRLQGIMLFNTAIVHKDGGAYDSVRYYLAAADAKFQEGELLVERSAVNKLRASVEREKGRIDDGLRFALLSRELAARAGDSSRMADADTEIAFGYYELENYPAAIESFEEGLAYYLRQNDYYFAAQCLINLITAYQENGQREIALERGLKGLEFVVSNKFTDLESDARRSLGYIYLQLGNLAEAQLHLQRAEELTRGPYQGGMLSEVLGFLADVRLRYGDTGEAIALAQEALELGQKNGQLDFVKYALDVLVQAYEREGKFAVALDYQQQKQVVRDSLYQDEMVTSLAELTTRYEKEKQDRLIAEQQSQLALLEAQAKVDQLQKTGLGLGIILLVILLSGVWYGFRQRTLRQQLEKQQLAEKIQVQQRELSAHALQMAQKSQLLDQLGAELQNIKGERPDDRKKLNGMIRELNSEERINQDWDNFRTYFQGVHGDFEERLTAATSAQLSPREIRLSALIKMQLNNQEIGSILGVSQESLYKAKYRLRKKLPQVGDGELDRFLLEF